MRATPPQQSVEEPPGSPTQNEVTELDGALELLHPCQSSFFNFDELKSDKP